MRNKSWINLYTIADVYFMVKFQASKNIQASKAFGVRTLELNFKSSGKWVRRENLTRKKFLSEKFLLPPRKFFLNKKFLALV